MLHVLHTTPCIAKLTDDISHMIAEMFGNTTPKQYKVLLESREALELNAETLYRRIRDLCDSNAPERVAVRKVSTIKSVQRGALRDSIAEFAHRQVVASSTPVEVRA